MNTTLLYSNSIRHSIHYTTKYVFFLLPFYSSFQSILVSLYIIVSHAWEHVRWRALTLYVLGKETTDMIGLMFQGSVHIGPPIMDILMADLPLLPLRHG